MDARFERLLKELKDLEDYILRIKNKDLSFKIASKDYEESQQLYEHLEGMRANLADIIADITSDSGSLLSSAVELHKLSAGVQKTSKDMNAKAEEVANATHEMTDNVNSVSASAEELSINMSTVANNANQSAENINSVAAATEEMTATISEIASNADNAKTIVNTAVMSLQNANSKIEELNVATKEINTVSASISDIAEQTKLLALNATIEAARAGDAGLRFSVVANEVKSLATETNNATIEIHSKVNAMLTAAQATFQEISHVSKVINEVNKLVGNIALSVDMQSDTTKEISSSINYAAQGITEVTNAVNDANYAVQDVAKNITEAASLANNVASAIKSVSDDSNRLKDDATLLYMGAMEVNSHGSDLDRMVKMIKLPVELNIKKASTSALFKFTDPFRVHVNEMDNHHIQIFNYINDVHAAIKQGQNQQTILRIVIDLRNYTDNHFREEEKLMKKINYEGLPYQITAHKDLISKVDEIIHQFKSNQEVNLIEVMVFLKDWLVVHILGMDQKYSVPMHEANVY
ncbi:MAG TPA: bacteriohemerythrin [Candidatus Cloacimonadota bacterium]|nr:bacteriohemerythrin [Candidatus Cloacimonadales bacterium]HPY95778.1 bacteriohemerythrin [Candidatus Cloacimonadota bacterium]HQB40308.1 bacteriohemerythrin [Candidatus Cloacimonadota bacterium]